MTEIQAWHFLPADRRIPTRSDDAAHLGGTLVAEGTVLRISPPLHLCTHGLHGSERLIDALKYAPGSILTRCLYRGDIVNGDDKLAATEREVIWIGDVSHLLREFACWTAEGALVAERMRGREPHPASWAAVATRREWLAREATDEQVSAAWSAACSAAESASWSAAWSAAWSEQNDWLTSAVRHLAGVE